VDTSRQAPEWVAPTGVDDTLRTEPPLRLASKDWRRVERKSTMDDMLACHTVPDSDRSHEVVANRTGEWPVDWLGTGIGRPRPRWGRVVPQSAAPHTAKCRWLLCWATHCPADGTLNGFWMTLS
jgi:hypothetical protein